ncbi:MAG TPA: RNA polymerase sigma factor [Mariniphaga sp.]|nr:RNA polymerase sigma factor [Mariniphaga sp.]
MKEEDLIQGIIRRDEDAFRDMVDTYRKMVVNTCFGLLHNMEDAEDVAQEVFIEIYRSIHKFKGDSKLSTWIYRIAVNKALNYIRDTKRYSWLQSFSNRLNTENQKLYRIKADDESNPDFDIQASQRADILHKAIDSLPENQKIAFILSKYEELSNKEIAEIMSRTVVSVESLIHRAKMNLQKKLYQWHKKNYI